VRQVFVTIRLVHRMHMGALVGCESDWPLGSLQVIDEPRGSQLSLRPSSSERMR
jgi:hypothetical protein